MAKLKKFAQASLAAGNYPDTASNETFVESEAGYEGTAAANNPLATTEQSAWITQAPPAGGWPASYPLPGNSAGVQQYPTFQEGADATADTWDNGDYPDINSALQQGDAWQAAQSGSLNSDLSTWGTSDMVAAQQNGTLSAGSSTASLSNASGALPGEKTGSSWWDDLVRGAEETSPAYVVATGQPQSLAGQISGGWINSVTNATLKAVLPWAMIGLGLTFVIIGLIVTFHSSGGDLVEKVMGSQQGSKAPATAVAEDAAVAA